MDWSGGANSNKSPTIAGVGNPNGIAQNQLCWLNNGTIRGNGISPRAGWVRRAVMPRALYQGGFMYQPDGALPYVMTQIGGRIYQVRVDTDYSIVDLSGETMPPTVPRGYMAQAEQFLVIQAGDFTTLPLFWDGVTLRRSIGPAVSYGITAADFVVPPVGQSVLVTLTAPYAGSPGEELLINGKTYRQATPEEFITLTNVSDVAGTNYPANTQIRESDNATELARTLSTFTAPAVGNNVSIPIDPSYSGAVPHDVRIGPVISSKSYQITAAGAGAIGANQVYLINMTDTPGANVLTGSILSSLAELPAAGPMDYYMGRMWLANGREYVAGDIVGGPTGTPAYSYRDSVLKLVENTYLSLGGTFRVPTNAGNIRAIKHTTALDTATGEGQLLVLTRETIYSVNVVPTRAQWQALSEPIQRVVQTNFGTTSDWSVTPVNGDLFYRSPNGINSFFQADRFFGQWGNRPISIEEFRAINIEDRSLLGFASGITFDNRVLQTSLPEQSDVGVIHKGLLPLNFDTISTLDQKNPPAWEGILEGLDILQVLKADFGGRERAFAFVRSRESGNNIELWELTAQELEDTNTYGDSRITWSFEVPAFTWDKPFQLKELDTMELWVDRLFGTVDFYVEFRPDQHPCWESWFRWQICSPRNNCEDPWVLQPCPYPSVTYKPSYRATMILPVPPSFCQTQNARPVNHGFSFQFRVFIKGYCRIRGLLFHAYERDRAPYDRIVCGDQMPGNFIAPLRTIG